MGRKKRGSVQKNNEAEAAKKPKLESGETFLVKKYRAEKNYAAMEAFVRYTKAHRMLDSSYVRWNVGVTPEKPFVFSTRVGGVDLGWGRGRTREAAMDAACRSAFALVNAHGYKNFPVDDDCFTELEAVLASTAPPPHNGLPPPPPPPPPGVPPPPLPPAGLPLLPGGVGLPPLPTHVLPPPPMPPINLPPPPTLIPQPQLPKEAPVATSMEHKPVALNFSTTMNGGENSSSNMIKPKELKGGLLLIYDPGSEGVDEECMEEKRARLPRYQLKERM